MKNAYYIAPAELAGQQLHAPEINAAHLVTLPGVICPACGPWAATGVQYPSVDAVSLKRKFGKFEPWPVSLEKFADLRSKLSSFVSIDQKLTPGCKLGRLKGEARGKFGDFAWLNPWTVLVRGDVFQVLSDEFNLVGIEADLDFGTGFCESLLEIEASPLVKLVAELVPKPCNVCGRIPIRAPERIILDASSFDETKPIQRILELPTFIILNGELARCIQKMNYTDVTLIKVEIRS